MIKDCETAEATYLKWRNEKEIGGMVDPPVQYDKNHPKRVFFEYIQSHMDYFIYCEPLAAYHPSLKRHDEILKLDPRSKYLPEIEYSDLVYLNYALNEGGIDEKSIKEMIEKYKQFINTSPKSTYAIEAKKRIAELKKYLKPQ